MRIRKAIMAGFAVMILSGAGEDDVCGAHYTAEDFVGEYLMETGTGFVTADGGGSVIPMTNESEGPVTIFLLGSELVLATGWIDLTMEVAETPDYALPDLAEDIGGAIDAELIPGLLGCPLEQLQRFQGGGPGTTPEGEAILYQIVTVVTAENSDQEPDQMMGSLYWHGGGMTGTRSVFFSRQ